MHKFQEHNKKGLLDIEKERQSRPGHKHGSENRDRSRSNQRVVDGPKNRPTFAGSLKNAISSHIEGKAPAARRKSNESSSGESPLSISVDSNNPENRTFNKHLGGKGPRKKYASNDQEDSHNLSKKMNFRELFDKDKPANNAGSGNLERSFDPFRRDVYSEESSSRVQVVRPTGGILGNLWNKQENMITPKKAHPFLRKKYDVRNDSSEEEKEDFILDGSSQDGDSPRRIVSITENAYGTLAKHIFTRGFQVKIDFR